MSTPYSTLLVFDWEAKAWSPEFGSYAKYDVEQQVLDEYQYDLTCILTTAGVSQESIMAKIAVLNDTRQ